VPRPRLLRLGAGRVPAAWRPGCGPRWEAATRFCVKRSALRRGLTGPLLSPAGDNISLILKAAGVEVEPYWPTLFAKLCKGKNVGDMLSAVGSAPAAGGGGAAAPAAAGAAAAAAPPAKAEEPEEEEEEMGFDLFGAPRRLAMPPLAARVGRWPRRPPRSVSHLAHRCPRRPCPRWPHPCRAVPPAAD